MGFGSDLPDQIEAVNEYATESLRLFGEMRDYLKERAALETDYADRLEKLSQSTAKRLKRFPTLLYGPTAKSLSKKELTNPKDWQDEQLASFLEAWLGSLYETSQSAQKHTQLVSQWSESVIEPIKMTCQQSDEMRKKHQSFVEKLHADVHRAVNDLEKARVRFEDSQKKASLHQTSFERALTDDRASDKEKFKKSSEQAEADLVQCHNEYILSMIYANAIKNNYYTKSMPIVLDEFQQLIESTYTSISDAMACLSRTEKTTHEDIVSLMTSSESRFAASVSPSSDSELFIKHHRCPTSFIPPNDVLFNQHQPAHLTPFMLSGNGSVILHNLAIKLTQRLETIDKQMTTANKESEGLSTLLDAYRRQTGQGSVHDVTRHMHEVQYQLNELSCERLALSLQLDHIQSNLNATANSNSNHINKSTVIPHTFQPTSFALPKTCDLCKTSLWGSSRHGLMCTECGYNCHSKCELKVVPDCSKVPKSRSKSQYQTTSRPSSVNDTIALAIFDYTALNGDELTIKQGDKITLMGEEQGGWHYARYPMNGREGWVPVSYLDFTNEATPKMRIAYAMYPYTGKTVDELSMKEGDTVEVIEEDKGDGWCMAKIQGRIGHVPANYIE